MNDWNEFHLRPPGQFPLLSLEKQIEYQMERSDNVFEVLIALTFLIVIELLQWAEAEREAGALGHPLSPSLREELRNLDEIKSDYTLLTGQNIRTVDDLSMFRETKAAQIKAMEEERQHCRNQLRRPKPPEATL